MEENVKEVTSHGGFGQHSPSSVPGVPCVGRMTGTPQGQLLPGLWPKEQVGARSTVCLSTGCRALPRSTKAGTHQRASGEGASGFLVPWQTSPALFPLMGGLLAYCCWLSSLFFQRILFFFFLMLLFYYSKCSQNRRESMTCVLFWSLLIEAKCYFCLHS